MMARIVLESSVLESNVLPKDNLGKNHGQGGLVRNSKGQGQEGTSPKWTQEDPMDHKTDPLKVEHCDLE